MKHYVPEFEMEDEYTIPTSSNLIRSNKSAMPENEIMELLWENGQVVMQSQAQRSLKKSNLLPKYDDDFIPSEQAVREFSSTQGQSHHHHQQQQQHLFMQEEEMACWIHYPLNDDGHTHFDNDFCADLLYPPAACLNSTTADPESRPHAETPPVPPTRRAAEVAKNFSHCSRQRARGGANASGPSSLVRESTVVDSNDTPAVGFPSRFLEAAVPKSADDARRTGLRCGRAAAGTSSAAATGSSSKEMTACEATVTSSPGGSSGSAEALPHKVAATVNRKRKGRDEVAECHNEDAEFESVEAKKQVRGSTSTKRSRAAEVHNLSERRRRDRINEKMRALQELIPRCNKSDKASMLDEAIEYLKSLQLQVQMMSMGCGMVPMMFPGVRQYMQQVGMGMGMGMEMGMNRPMMPFPNVMAGAPLPMQAAAAAHLGPRFPMPAFHMPHVPSPDQSQIQAANQSDPMFNSLVAQNPNQPRVPNYTDSYQQYLNLHQMQMPMSMPQSQAMTGKPNTSQGHEHIDNHQSVT